MSADAEVLRARLQAPLPIARHGIPRAGVSPWMLGAAVSDAVSALTAVAIAFANSSNPGGMHTPIDSRAVMTAVVAAVAWLALLAANGAYSDMSLHTSERTIRPAVDAALWAALVIAAGAWFLHSDPGPAVPALGVAFALSGFGRGVIAVALHMRSAKLPSHRCLVIGPPGDADMLALHLERHPRCGLRVAAIHRDRGDALALANLLQELQAVDADSILAAGGALAEDQLRSLAWALEGTGVRMLVAPPLALLAGPRLRHREIGGLPLAEVPPADRSGLDAFLKSAFDRVVASALLIAAAPLFGAIAVAVRLSGPGPLLFRQRRVGRHGRQFDMLKFRTMYDGAERDRAQYEHLNESDNVIFKIRRDPRVTAVGRVLRRFSLDEMPQLINVIGGSMSLVGPRPPIPTEVARYPEDARRRLLIKPGLTGLWQVSGRSDLSWEEMLRLDLHYIEHWSVAMDVRLLLRTVLAVVSGRGAY